MSEHNPPIGFGPPQPHWSGDPASGDHGGPRGSRGQGRHGHAGPRGEFGPGGPRGERGGPRGNRGPRGPMGPQDALAWAMQFAGDMAAGGATGSAGPGGWGPGGRGRGGRGRGRGPRRERGDVRAAVLLLLAEQPRHGYDILGEIADRSDGNWQPSPGSVYPTLKRLAQEGLVQPEQDDSGRRVFALTEQGRATVEAERDGWGEPWQVPDADEGAGSAQAAELEPLWQEAKQLAAAVWQVAQLNDPASTTAATEALAEARKSIYRRLAE